MTVRMKERPTVPPDAEATAREDLLQRFRSVRGLSEALAAPLHPEDQVVQSMPDASPTKWHLAHTTWFFETFLLPDHAPGYAQYDPDYAYLFNSYYYTIGQMHHRPSRGLLSRPTVGQIMSYRAHVSEAVAQVIETVGEAAWPEIARIIELGLNHEQQHQELLLTDIKHAMFMNPLRPAVYRAPPVAAGAAPALQWEALDGGIHAIGHEGEAFAFDNETPRHEVLMQDSLLASRPVTNAEYLEFIRDGGYGEVSLWLSEGWASVQQEGWQAPLYWVKRDGDWFEFTLGGLVPLDPARPVAHVSLYEAAAFAAWAGQRLPTEFELERMAVLSGPDAEACGQMLDPADWLDVSSPCAPEPAACSAPSEGFRQVRGTVWEWTQSAYGAYPGYRPLPGALGEYNGKFMCSQNVLRGGSCATPRGHLRPTYRNFFPPHARWQFSGIRLAADAG